MSWRSVRYSQSGSPEARMWRIATTLVPVLILNNFFGNNLHALLGRPGWLAPCRLDQRGTTAKHYCSLLIG